MQIVIDIPKDRYSFINSIKDGVSDYQTSMMLYNAIRNGTPIPDNATNGDVIKAMFGVKEVDMSNTYCVHFPEEEDYSHYFFKEWWNALYKVESEDEG